MNNKGQLSLEGIISAVIAVILYLIVATYVFNPIFEALSPTLENVGGGYGVIAGTILNITIYIILPLLLIVTAVMYVRPKVIVEE